MNEQRARTLLKLDHQTSITERHVQDAWAKSNKSHDATEAARFLRDFVRVNTAISRLPRIECWADEND